jgi:prenyltransferase/squalene oxidase-like repeat protein
MKSGLENSDVARICLPFLRDAQNPDGGWGFRPGNTSRVEATCWALLALWEPSQESSEDRVRVHRARDFLQTAQLGDGSWPAAPGEETGCWVTSLCCLALYAIGDQTQHTTIESGLRWVCNDWPSDSTPWRRLLVRLASRDDVAPINTSYRGWGWTPGTSSWVEPTSFALLALERVESAEFAAKAKGRRSSATSLLFDRMCPGGGWNAGNPVVYGAAGEPGVVPTVCSLLALRNAPARGEITQSLDWMERAAASIQSPGSLALAQICLRRYGRLLPAGAAGLSEILKGSDFLEDTLAAAWAVLSCGSDFWLGKPDARMVAA